MRYLFLILFTVSLNAQILPSQQATHYKKNSVSSDTWDSPTKGNYISISNQPNVYTRVEAVLINHIREGYYIVNNELMISNDHPVMTNYGKKKVEELKIGDFVGDNEVRSLVYNAGDVKTVSIITSAEDFNVYVNDKIYSVNGKYSTLLKPGEQKDEKLIA